MILVFFKLTYSWVGNDDHYVCVRCEQIDNDCVVCVFDFDRLKRSVKFA